MGILNRKVFKFIMIIMINKENRKKVVNYLKNIITWKAVD